MRYINSLFTYILTYLREARFAETAAEMLVCSPSDRRDTGGWDFQKRNLSGPSAS